MGHAILGNQDPKPRVGSAIIAAEGLKPLGQEMPIPPLTSQPIENVLGNTMATDLEIREIRHAKRMTREGIVVIQSEIIQALRTLRPGDFFEKKAEPLRIGSAGCKIVCDLMQPRASKGGKVGTSIQG